MKLLPIKSPYWRRLILDCAFMFIFAFIDSFWPSEILTFFTDVRFAHLVYRARHPAIDCYFPMAVAEYCGQDWCIVVIRPCSVGLYW
ncbi:hypothetical protein [Dickeya oryzae]